MGFKGPLGSGKTTLIRLILQFSGVKERIKSPTFAKVESYQSELGPMYHFDLYRLAEPKIWLEEGFFEYKENGICLIEWPEMAFPYLVCDAYVNMKPEKTGVYCALEPAIQ